MNKKKLDNDREFEDGLVSLLPIALDGVVTLQFKQEMHVLPNITMLDYCNYTYENGTVIPCITIDYIRADIEDDLNYTFSYDWTFTSMTENKLYVQLNFSDNLLVSNYGPKEFD